MGVLSKTKRHELLASRMCLIPVTMLNKMMSVLSHMEHAAIGLGALVWTKKNLRCIANVRLVARVGHVVRVGLVAGVGIATRAAVAGARLDETFREAADGAHALERRLPLPEDHDPGGRSAGRPPYLAVVPQ